MHCICIDVVGQRSPTDLLQVLLVLVHASCYAESTAAGTAAVVAGYNGSEDLQAQASALNGQAQEYVNQVPLHML